MDKGTDETDKCGVKGEELVKVLTFDSPLHPHLGRLHPPIDSGVGDWEDGGGRSDVKGMGGWEPRIKRGR